MRLLNPTFRHSNINLPPKASSIIKKQTNTKLFACFNANYDVNYMPHQKEKIVCILQGKSFFLVETGRRKKKYTDYWNIYQFQYFLGSAFISPSIMDEKKMGERKQGKHSNADSGFWSPTHKNMDAWPRTVM